MNIICLLDNPEVVIASGRRVFSSEDTGALLSLSESADKLQSTVNSEEDRVQQAEHDARERGREEGIEQGRQIATAELAETQLALTDKTNAELNQVRQEVLSLALQVVRKVADGVANDDLLFSLANTAAQECLPSKSIVLKVHPNAVDGVKQRLSESLANSDSEQLIHNVVSDEDLDINACVLETDAGQVCADLDTQLSVLEKHLSASPAVSSTENNISDDSAALGVAG